MADIEFSVGVTPASIRKAQNDINKVFFGQTSRLVDKVQKQQVGINKALKQGRSEAFQFGRNVQFAAKRLLAWAAPAALIFATIGSLRDAVAQVVKLDTAARRLQFFAGRGALVKGTASAVRGLNKDVGTLGSTLSGLNTTQRAFANLKSSAERTSTGISLMIRTSRQLGVSLDDVSEAIITVSRVGGNLVKTTRDLTQGIKGANSELVKGVISLIRLEDGALKAEDAVRGFVAIQQQFFRSATDSAKAAVNLRNIMAKIALVSTKTAADISDLSEATRRVGSAFKAVQGINLDQTLALLEVGFNTTGASVSRLSTGLRRMTTFAVKNAKEIKDISGINIIDPDSGQIRGLNAILEVLQKIKASAGTALAEELARAFGGRNIEQTLAYADNIDAVKKALGEVDSIQKRAAKTAQALAAQREQDVLLAASLTSQTNKLKASITGLVESDTARSAIGGVLNIITSMADGLNNTIKLISENKTLFATIATVIGVQIVKGIANFVAGLKDGVRSAKEVASELSQIVSRQHQVAANAAAIRAAGGPAGGPAGAITGAGAIIPGATTATGSSVPTTAAAARGATGQQLPPRGATETAGRRFTQSLPPRGFTETSTGPLSFPSRTPPSTFNPRQIRADIADGIRSGFRQPIPTEITGASVSQLSSAVSRAGLGGASRLPGVSTAIIPGARTPTVVDSRSPTVLAARAQSFSISQGERFGTPAPAPRRISPAEIPRTPSTQQARTATITPRRTFGGLAQQQLGSPNIPASLGRSLGITQAAGSLNLPASLGLVPTAGARGVSPFGAAVRPPTLLAGRAPTILSGQGSTSVPERLPTKLAGQLGQQPIPGSLQKKGITQAQGTLAFGRRQTGQVGQFINTAGARALSPDSRSSRISQGFTPGGLAGLKPGSEFSKIAPKQAASVFNPPTRRSPGGLTERAQNSFLGTRTGVLAAGRGAELQAQVKAKTIRGRIGAAREAAGGSLATPGVGSIVGGLALQTIAKPLEDIISKATNAGIGKGFGEAASGAGLGAQLGGPIGAIAGALAGAIGGAITGVFEEVAKRNKAKGGVTSTRVQAVRLTGQAKEVGGEDSSIFKRAKRLREQFADEQKEAEELGLEDKPSPNLVKRLKLLQDEIKALAKLKQDAKDQAKEEAAAVDKVKQRGRLLRRVVELTKSIGDSSHDTAREVELIIEREKVLARLKKQGFKDSLLQLSLEEKRRVILKDIVKLRDTETDTARSAGIVQEALLSTVGGRSADKIKLQFDRETIDRQLKILKKEIEGLSGGISAGVRTDGDTARLKQAQKEQADAQAKLISLRIQSQTKAVDIAKSAALEQINAWKDGAQIVVEAFSKIAALQSNLSSTFASVGNQAQEQIESASATMQSALEASGASIGTRLAEVRNLAGARLSANVASTGRQLSTTRGGDISQRVTGIGEQTDELINALVKAAKTANDKISDDESKNVRFELAARRTLIAQERAGLEAEIRDTNRAIGIRKTSLQLEVQIIKQRLASEIALDKLRRDQQASFGKLLLESPEQFKETLKDIALSEKFFAGIKNINLGNLTEVSSRISQTRGRGGNEILLRVLRGLEARSQFGGGQAVGGVGNAQLSQIFQQLQRGRPQDVDADVRKQAQIAEGAATDQKAIKARQDRIAQLTEVEAQIQQQQLKIAAVDAQVALSQREQIRQILEETKRTLSEKLETLISIQRGITDKTPPKVDANKAKLDFDKLKGAIEKVTSGISQSVPTSSGGISSGGIADANLVSKEISNAFLDSTKIGGAVSGLGGQTFVGGRNQGRNIAREFLSDSDNRAGAVGDLRSRLDPGFETEAEDLRKDGTQSQITQFLESEGFGQVAAGIGSKEDAQKALDILLGLNKELDRNTERLTGNGLKKLTQLFALAFTQVAESAKGKFTRSGDSSNTGGTPGQGGGNGGSGGSGGIGGPGSGGGTGGGGGALIDNIVAQLDAAGQRFQVFSDAQIGRLSGAISEALKFDSIKETFENATSSFTEQINRLENIRIQVDVPTTEHKVEVSIQNAISSKKFAADIAESLAEFFIPQEEANRMSNRIAKMSQALIKARMIQPDADGQ